MSDKDIATRSGILDLCFWKEGDSCMTDKQFTIADDLKALDVEFNMPAFLSGRDQLTRAEVKESQSIAFVHIPAERAI